MRQTFPLIIIDQIWGNYRVQIEVNLPSIHPLDNGAGLILRPRSLNLIQFVLAIIAKNSSPRLRAAIHHLCLKRSPVQSFLWTSVLPIGAIAGAKGYVAG